MSYVGKVVSAALVVSAFVASSGCGSDYDDIFVPLTDPALARTTTGTGGTGGTTTTIEPGCIPRGNSEPVRADCGVFVSSSMGSDGNDGSMAKPYATVGKAIAAAQGEPIYLCAETFAEAVHLTSGLKMFGGMDCANGWKHVGDTAKSEIAPAAGEVPLVLATSVKATLVDVALHAKNAVEMGTSSVAVIASNEAELSLAYSDVAAGNGTDGATGQSFGTGASAGATGNPGQDACSAAIVVPGDSATSMCDAADPNDDSISGLGGIGSAASGGPGGTGSPGQAMNGGVGGRRTRTRCTAVPARWATPARSAPPQAAPTASADQRAGGTPATPATRAEKGKPGQGGGGGGGAKGGSGMPGNCADAANAGGASGGSRRRRRVRRARAARVGKLAAARSGSCRSAPRSACRGHGHRDGRQGRCWRRGWRRSSGWARRRRRTGGTKGAATWLKDGCAGGNGGSGGAGGKAGGGLGGPSIGIAYTGDAPTTKDVTFTIGMPGDGGAGDGAMGAGAKGVAAETQSFGG